METAYMTAERKRLVYGGHTVQYRAIKCAYSAATQTIAPNRRHQINLSNRYIDPSLQQTSLSVFNFHPRSAFHFELLCLFGSIL